MTKRGMVGIKKVCWGSLKSKGEADPGLKQDSEMERMKGSWVW